MIINFFLFAYSVTVVTFMAVDCHARDEGRDHRWKSISSFFFTRHGRDLQAQVLVTPVMKGVTILFIPSRP